MIARYIWFFACLPAMPLSAQSSRPSSAPETATAAQAIEKWLASDQTKPELRARAVQAMLDEGPSALEVFARILKQTVAASEHAADRGRMQGVDALLIDLANSYLQREVNSGMSYAGQYRDLRVLQPHIGRYYLQLLLDPPQWFRIEQRPLVVPALRDLYPESPGRDIVVRLKAMLKDEQQPEMLSWRLAVAYALAQWGDREVVDERIAKLKTALTSADADESLRALHELAEVHYDLREYAKAAAFYRQFLRRAEKSGSSLTPSDYYNAACNLSLTGDLEAALDEIEHAIELMRSGSVDSSQMLDSKLLEKDPDIAAVRPTARFKRLLERAFPKKDLEDR